VDVCFISRNDMLTCQYAHLTIHYTLTYTTYILYTTLFQGVRSWNLPPVIFDIYRLFSEGLNRNNSSTKAINHLIECICTVSLCVGYPNTFLKITITGRDQIRQILLLFKSTYFYLLKYYSKLIKTHQSSIHPCRNEHQRTKGSKTRS
jgi:hypothetical protein